MERVRRRGGTRRHEKTARGRSGGRRESRPESRSRAHPTDYANETIPVVHRRRATDSDGLLYFPRARRRDPARAPPATHRQRRRRRRGGFAVAPGKGRGGDGGVVVKCGGVKREEMGAEETETLRVPELETIRFGAGISPRRVEEEERNPKAICSIGTRVGKAKARLGT